MIVSHLSVKNWRNFKQVDVDLRARQFIVGANASGKSNLLDVFRFLRDVVKVGGGLQQAVNDRGGVSKIRSLAARRHPVEMSIRLSADAPEGSTTWCYEFGFKQEPRGDRRTLLTHERVWKDDREILDRPTDEDEADPARLTQTYLEQVNVNADFREIVHFFKAVTYIHLVPQLLREPALQVQVLEGDPFGKGFLTRLARTNEKTLKSRLAKIQKALEIAVPQFKELAFMHDEEGHPHLQARYSHWRPHAGWQREDQFSDGTLRLLGILWSLLESDSLLLLEEPELSLNGGIVSQLAPLFSRIQRNRKRQLLVSTHSSTLLMEEGINGGEVLLLSPANEGTKVEVAADIAEVRALLESGFTVGEAVLPRTKPSGSETLSRFE